MLFVEPPVAVPAQSFAAPVVVTRTAQDDSGPPAVALDAQGNALIAWRGQDGRVRVRAGARAVRAASRGTAYQPEVALAPDGTAATLYVRYLKRGRRLLEPVAPPGQAFGRPQRLVSVVANVTAWHLFAAGDRFVAVWWQGVPGHDHAIRYAISEISRFGPVQTLAQVDGNGSVSAAVDAGGSVLATWGGAVAEEGRVLAAVLAPGAPAFAAPQAVPDSRYSYSQAFGGPAGLAVGYGIARELRFAPVGEAARVVTTLKEDKRGTSDFLGPVFALRTPGATVAAWARMRAFANQESEEPVGGSVDAAAEQADGSFSAPTRLTAPGEFPIGIVRAAATPSTAIVLWPTGRFKRQRLRYSAEPRTRADAGARRQPRRAPSPPPARTRSPRGSAGGRSGSPACARFDASRSQLGR